MNMFIYYLVVTFVFGLVFGSFLNCAAMRIARNEDFIHGHSHCMHCGHELGAADLIPVLSWVFSGGKCRYCGGKVSIRYPLTELGFACLCAGVYLRFGLSAECLRDLVLVGCLFTLSIVDIESFTIPDGTLVIGVIAWIVACPFMSVTPAYIGHHIAAGLLCGGLMLGMSLVMDRILKKDSLGGGDIKLFALLGLYLGYLGSYFLVLISCVLGLIFAAAWKAVSSGQGSDESVSAGAFPFGPAIAVSGYIMLLFGDLIGNWYMGFIL